MVPKPPVDHHIGIERLQAALEGLDLADLVVLLDVGHPELVAVLLEVDILVLAVRRAEDLGLEVVLLSKSAKNGIVESNKWNVSTTITFTFPDSR